MPEFQTTVTESPLLLEVPQNEAEMKAFVQRYMKETEFPNSSGRIRSHMRELLNGAILPNNIPMVAVTCDRNCSVGEGQNNALPGSDIDKLEMFSEGKIPDDDVEKLRNSVMEKYNPMLVNLSRYDFYPNSISVLTDLAKYNDIDWRKIDEALRAREPVDNTIMNARRSIQQLVYGTRLFEKDIPLIGEIKDSTSGKTIQPLAPIAENDGSPIRQRKYTARKLLRANFANLDAASQYAIVRSQLQWTANIGTVKVANPLDFEIGGKDDAVLSKLAKDGYFYLNGDRYGKAW